MVIYYFDTDTVICCFLRFLMTAISIQILCNIVGTSIFITGTISNINATTGKTHLLNIKRCSLYNTFADRKYLMYRTDARKYQKARAGLGGL